MLRRMMTGSRTPRAVLAVVAAGGLVAACGSSSSSKGASATSATTAAAAGGGGSSGTTAGGGGSSGTTSGKAPSGTPYYIGAELSLTGAYSSFETPMLSGLQVAVEDINASGGVLGHPVALAYQSDGSDPTKVVPALQSIFKPGRKFFYMLPNVLPNVTAQVLQYTQKLGIPSFDAGSGAGIFDIKTHPYNYSIYPANSVQIPAYLAAYEKVSGTTSLSGLKVGIISDTEQADVQLSSLIAAAAKKQGAQVVSQQSVDPTATDVSVQVQKAMQAGAQVLQIQGAAQIATEVAQSLQQLHWTTVKLVVTPADNNPQTLSSVPASVKSQYFGLGEQIYLQNPAGTGPLPKYATFASELAKTPGGIDDLEISANIRDSAVIAAFAANKAGSLDIKKVTAVLDNLSGSGLPSSSLTWLPDPGWTSSDHGFDHADLSTTWWALLSPGAPVQGTYKGVALTIPAALQNTGAAGS